MINSREDNCCPGYDSLYRVIILSDKYWLLLPAC